MLEITPEKAHANTCTRSFAWQSIKGTLTDSTHTHTHAGAPLNSWQQPYSLERVRCFLQNTPIALMLAAAFCQILWNAQSTLTGIYGKQPCDSTYAFLRFKRQDQKLQLEAISLVIDR